jgi:serine/threonine-protein kinase HipA
MKNKEIFVYTDWVGLGKPVLMGVLFSDIIRGKEVFSFEYSDLWLDSKQRSILDPDLGFYSGPQYMRDDKSNFGLFLDSSPDRWGRVLMRRRESILARKENRSLKNLYESDFLLGVYDVHRMGALRFKLDLDGEFLDNNRDYAAPPWSTIRDLEYASMELERNIEQDNPDLLKWINLLMAPGSSLGGARPKASVQDVNGELWIAKFPSKDDLIDTGAWEMVANEMAQMCGINTAVAMVKRFNNKHHTYLTKRFDRINNERLHFSSAMTMLGYTDGASAAEGVSYLEIAEFIILNGANVDADLRELFKRIVLSIAISNTDDHLRNHGFILTKDGWILSPVYDVNPNHYGGGLKLNISENDNSQDFSLALSVAPFFRLSGNEAEKIINNIKKVVADWRVFATKYKIPKVEQDFMSQAFLFRP